jgi:hypothetical protein
MGGINVKRWLAGGIAAGALIWIVEGAASTLYMSDMQAALERHGITLVMNAWMWILSVVVSLLMGLTLVFFYAAARPRFGAGPRTAVIVAIAFWIGASLLSLIGYQMIGLYPNGMLVEWGVVGLVEGILATLSGGWIYRET